MDTKTIAARFQEAGVALGEKDTWTVQRAVVIKHAALERLAAGTGITFDPPTIVRAEADEAVVLVTGRMGDKSEWSFGEARIGLNYRVSGKMAGYPYAMAEKRGKDRVIIKLVGLHGVYSSEEADAFDERAQEAAPPARKPTPVKDSWQAPGGGPGIVAQSLAQALQMAGTVDELREWAMRHKPQIDALPEGYANDVRRAYQSHMRRLQPRQEAAE